MKVDVKEQRDEPQMHGELTPVGWFPGSEELAWPQWVEVGRALGRAELKTKFARGDWIRYGEHRWGGKYAEAIQETGLAYDTVRQERYVSERVEIGYRKPELSWSHHLAVAPLEPAEQERWLTKAEAEGMSVATLRAEIDRATLKRVATRASSSLESGGASKKLKSKEPKQGEREKIWEEVLEARRRGDEESKGILRDLFRSAEAGESKGIAAKLPARRVEPRSGITVEELAAALHTDGGREPKVRQATSVILDLVAALTGPTNPEEIAEQAIQPEHIAQRLEEAVAAEEWFSIFRAALERRAS